MRPMALLVTNLFLISFSVNGWSQPRSKNDALVAERLFKMGIVDMDAKKYETACPMLAQSQELDPHHGTLVAWADCEDRAGRLATAFRLYEQYLQNVASMTEDQKNRHASRVKKAEVRREELRPMIPGLRIILPPSIPKNVKVWLNGSELAPAMLAVVIALDPGEHIVVLKQADGTSSEKRVTLKSGDHLRLELELPPPPFTEKQNELPPPPPSESAEPDGPDKQKPISPRKKEAAPPKPPTPSVAKQPLTDRPPIAPTSEKGTWYRTVGGIGLGAGGVGIGLGIVMGILAFQKQDTVEENCSGEWCSPTGIRAWQDGNIFADISTGAFIAGGVFTVLGTGLLLWSPDNPKPPTASTRPLQLGILQASPTSFMLGAQGTIF